MRVVRRDTMWLGLAVALAALGAVWVGPKPTSASAPRAYRAEGFSVDSARPGCSLKVLQRRWGACRSDGHGNYQFSLDRTASVDEEDKRGIVNALVGNQLEYEGKPILVPSDSVARKRAILGKPTFEFPQFEVFPGVLLYDQYLLSFDTPARGRHGPLGDKCQFWLRAPGPVCIDF
jgi:hypothetical protein